MKPAWYSYTAILIRAGKNRKNPFPLIFKAQTQSMLFDEHLQVYEEPEESEGDAEEMVSRLPHLTAGQALQVVNIPLHEGKTRPPVPFTEAGLVKQLEMLGVGRPSTYATMVKTTRHSPEFATAALA